MWKNCELRSKKILLMPEVCDKINYMVLNKEKKTEIISKFKKHNDDTGSAEVQIALLSERISGLVEHLKKNKKDQHSRRGLLMLVGKRKRLLLYLQRSDTKLYEQVVSSLGLK